MTKPKHPALRAVKVVYHHRAFFSRRRIGAAHISLYDWTPAQLRAIADQIEIEMGTEWALREVRRRLIHQGVKFATDEDLRSI